MVTRWDEDANPELEWFTCSIDQLATLRARALEDLELSPAVVNGLVGWLVGADVDAASVKTRAAYRAILREVGPPGAPPRRRRGARAGQRGAVRLQLIGAGAAAGAAVMASQAAPAPVSLVLAALAPIILDTPRETAQAATQGPVSLAERRIRRELAPVGPELARAVGF